MTDKYIYRKKAAEMFESGMTYEEIGKELNRSPFTVRGWLRGLNIRKPYKYEMLLSESEYIIERYTKDNATLAEIAKEYHCSHDQISKVLCACGVQRRKAGQPRKTGNCLRDKLDVKSICDDFKKGEKTYNLAKKYKCSQSTIETILSHNGLRYSLSDFEPPVFSWGKDETYCYDCADDCVNYRDEHCTLLDNTIFKDRNGQREVCSFYQTRGWR